MYLETLKRLVLSAFIGGLLSLILLMPVSLQSGLLDRVEPVARYFCPETGQFAPRYWHGRSIGNNPDNWEACLDGEGERVNSADTHRSIVFSVAGVWFVVVGPLLFMILGPKFPGSRNRLVKKRSGAAV